MKRASIHRLEYLCEIIPHLISMIPDKEFSHKPFSNKWSKKEILGHLLDSAANNHQRFVRVQFENTPFISYDADQWNAANYYMSTENGSLISLWKFYNKHLATLAQNIPEEKLQSLCKTGEGSIVTLEFLIEDYVVHLEHHLKQIVDYV